MKIILLLALLLGGTLNAQLKRPPIESPPNGIRLKGNLYMDATEVTNISWLEYEFHIKQDSSVEYLEANMPSKGVLNNFRSEYLRHPEYHNYPIVGISYEQALNYCKWRSNIVNVILEEDNKKWRIKYRLPTEKEWELAALTTDSISYAQPKTSFIATLMKGKRREIKRIFASKKIDFKELKADLEKYEESQVLSFILDGEKPWFILEDEKKPQSVYHFKEKSDSLIYTHIIGNVAELIMEKGVVKGGSWRHILATSFPSKRSLIDPEKVYDWVGFRCIAEVYELDK